MFNKKEKITKEEKEALEEKVKKDVKKTQNITCQNLSKVILSMSKCSCYL